MEKKLKGSEQEIPTFEPNNSTIHGMYLEITYSLQVFASCLNHNFQIFLQSENLLHKFCCDRTILNPSVSGEIMLCHIFKKKNKLNIPIYLNETYFYT